MFCGSFLLTEIVTNTKRVPTFWWRPDSVLFDLKILILMTLPGILRCPLKISVWFYGGSVTQKEAAHPFRGEGS